MSDEAEPEMIIEEGHKIKLSELKPLDVWAIIETYFRDNPNYKSQHQIDSFNEFIYSKTNGIEYIIKRENPQLMYKEELRKGQYKYEISIFYGETIIEDGEKKGEINTTKENIFVSSPIEYVDKKTSYMFPNIARLKGYTYASSIFCNIGVIFKNTIEDTMVIKNFEKVNIGSMPIMVKSKLCILNGMDPIRLTEVGECPYDQGGYFIIRGKEKVFLSQEKKINNILYINSSSDEKIPLESTLKSVSKEGFQSSRTNYIRLNRVKLNYQPSNTDVAENDSKYVYRITVRILGIGSPTDMKIPLFILFRALGRISDKDIIKSIIYDSDSPELKNELYELLEPSVKDSDMVYTQKEAYKLLMMHTKGKETLNVIELLKNNFLPNYKTNEEKSYFLGYGVRKLLLTRCKVISETDRDSYSFKRIDLAGSLLLELYRELWGSFQRSVSLKIDWEYKFNFKQYMNDITNIINEQNTSKIFSTRGSKGLESMDSIMKSFGSVFGTQLSGRQGIVQDLNRNVMLGTLSHLRRLSYPLPSGSKTIGPRKLHNSQWGFVCPSESPDGGNIGIINHLTIMAIVSFNVSEDGILTALVDHGLLSLQTIIDRDLDDTCKVFINGKWVGIHRDPEFLYKIMRLLKLNSLIHLYTSIYWDISKNEIYIFVDAGRLLRPVFVLKKIGSKYTNELIEGDYSYAKNWTRLIRGYMYDIDPSLSIYDETYYRDELQKIKNKYKTNYIDYLIENQSVIEYIDSMETEGLLIAKDIYSIDKAYTHSEIHSSLILGAVTLNIPFPEHSQYPRNVFSCKQTHAAVGMYSSAYNTRFDTFAHILNYSQKPVVTTRFKKYTDVDKLPYGTNVIAAIATYSGYNQEDAVILNKSSVERGLFNSLYFRSYSDSEEISGSGNRILFGNPLHQDDIKKSNTINFDKLDENGFVREGVYVDANDAIIARCEYDKNTNKIVSVMGKCIKFGTSGIVDKVIVIKNKDNLRTCKVRIRKNKIPDIGDKFSSRPGQKGVCGILLDQSEMPFTKDGIVPDMIVNPHAIPSRMTINQLLEVVLGKSSCLGGFLGDATPFQNNDIQDYAVLMQKYGYEEWGNEVMYGGMNGEQLHTSIFIGPTYYQRLKYIVADKVHSRATGPLQSLIRQPAQGKSNNGGVRIGEMERDSILAHGITSFLRESVMERSDKFKVNIDERSGLISNEINDSKIVTVHTPYAMKMLLQELQTMSIAPRLMTNQNINNPAVFDYLVDNFKL
jgi:DNA-directed RNA polymerase II subunit RPB2